MKDTIETKIEMGRSKIFPKFFLLSFPYQMVPDIRQKLLKFSFSNMLEFLEG